MTANSPRSFQLATPDGATVAEGVFVFGYYLVSWLGELPDRKPYPTIEEAIAAHNRSGDNLQVLWT